MNPCHFLYQSQAWATSGRPYLRQGWAYNRDTVLLRTPDGSFLHVLKSSETVVRRLYYYVVLSDTRHFHCQVFREGPIARRSSARLGDGPPLGSCRRPAHPDG